MDAVARISLYGTLFYVFLGIAVLGLALAVFFFVRFDIPTVRAMMTGRAKRKTVEKMQEQNAKTGNLRYRYPGHTGDTGKSGRTGKSGPTKDKPRITHPETPPQPPQQEERPETSVLNQEQNTTVLQPDLTATTVLGAPPPADFEPGETTRLTPPPAPVNIRFQLTETTLVIHTDEVI